MKKEILPYTLIFLSLILLALNIYRLDFKNLTVWSFAGIISNLLLIIGMSFNIRDINRNKKNSDLK